MGRRTEGGVWTMYIRDEKGGGPRDVRTVEVAFLVELTDRERANLGYRRPSAG